MSASQRVEQVRAILGDSREVLRTLADNSIDSCVTDPPYALVSITKRFGKDGAAPAKSNGATGVYGRAASGFMGQKWDTGETAFDPAFWAEVLRVLKPGAHLLAFGGTRTYHRLVCAIEDAGFEIRDAVLWHYGSGFPKSHDVSKGIDRAAGAEREVVGQDNNYGRSRLADGKTTFGDYAGAWDITAPATDAARQWEGWGSALKPSTEIICLARKPLSEATIAANVLRWGTGAINIDGARIGARTVSTGEIIGENVAMSGPNYGRVETGETTTGRWPANLILQGDEHGRCSDEVLAGFPETGPAKSGLRNPNGKIDTNAFGDYGAQPGVVGGHDDTGGSAARFFYCAKADSDDRIASKHPTVKPVDLMAYLIRLVTKKGGTVLDPFAGSGTTGEAAMREGCKAILIEREPTYFDDIQRRMSLALSGPEERSRAIVKASGKADYNAGPLFTTEAAE